MNTQSIMERRMEALGAYRRKPEKLPNTLDEGLAEIAYLKAIESSVRRRQGILLRLVDATRRHIIDLEYERLQLEKLYIPVTHCKFPTKAPVQHIRPKSRDEVLESWKSKSQEEIEKMIAELENL